MRGTENGAQKGRARRAEMGELIAGHGEEGE